MISILITLLCLFSISSAKFFDFIHNQFGGQHQQPQQTPLEYERAVLNSNCEKYLCPGTLNCVDGPKYCPCPFPSSQLRCFLPDGRYICISKPAGEISSKYADPATNWKIDAKDDNIRDCGWVARAWKGLV